MNVKNHPHQISHTLGGTIKRGWLFFLILIIILPACGAPAPAVQTQTLTVFAAASLTGAFGEIGNAFEAANPGVGVNFNFAGSQALRTQIEQGARADVFASANLKEMDALVAGDFVLADAPQIFLNNQLVVIMPADNPAGLSELEDLTESGLKLVFAAQEAPVGNYSFQALDKIDATLGEGFKEQVLANVVSYENDVKQVVAKVQLGEADAGIVYLSDAVAAPELQKIDIPVEQNVVASYPLAVLTQSKHPALAQDFVDYVLSAEGQSILKEWGFLPVN